MATHETEKYYRINLFLDKGCIKLTRAVIQKHVENSTPLGYTPNPWLLEDFLHHNQRSIFRFPNGKKRNNLMEEYKQLLVPIAPNKLNIDEWDLPLLCFVLLEMCNLSQQDKDDLKELKEIRNCQCHTTDASLSDREYADYSRKIKDIIQRFLRWLNDVNVAKEVIDIIKDIEDGPLTHLQELVRQVEEWQKSDQATAAAVDTLKLETTTGFAIQSANFKAMMDKQQQLFDLYIKGQPYQPPDAKITMRVLNCSTNKEDFLCSKLVDIFMEARAGNKSEEQLPKLLKEALSKLLNENVELMKAEKECVAIYLRCQSFESLTHLWTICVNGEITELFKPVEQCLREIPGCEHVELDVILTEDEFLRCIEKMGNQMKSSVTMATLLPSLYKQDNRNWVKGCTALKFARDGMEKFVDRNIHQFYQNVLANVLADSQCSSCSTENIVPCRYGNNFCKYRKQSCVVHDPNEPMKRNRHCPNSVCNKIRDEIERKHRFHYPSWSNTDCSRWCDEPWQLATCYMPVGYAASTSASQTDLAGLLSIITNNTVFDTVVEADLTSDNNVFCKARDVRYDILHKQDMKLSANGLAEYLKTLDDMLSDSKYLAKDPDAISARVLIQQLTEEALDDYSPERERKRSQAPMPKQKQLKSGRYSVAGAVKTFTNDEEEDLTADPTPNTNKQEFQLSKSASTCRSKHDGVIQTINIGTVVDMEVGQSQQLTEVDLVKRSSERVRKGPPSPKPETKKIKSGRYSVAGPVMTFTNDEEEDLTADPIPNTNKQEFQLNKSASTCRSKHDGVIQTINIGTVVDMEVGQSQQLTEVDLVKRSSERVRKGPPSPMPETKKIKSGRYSVAGSVKTFTNDEEEDLTADPTPNTNKQEFQLNKSASTCRSKHDGVIQTINIGTVVDMEVGQSQQAHILSKSDNIDHRVQCHQGSKQYDMTRDQQYSILLSKALDCMGYNQYMVKCRVAYWKKWYGIQNIILGPNHSLHMITAGSQAEGVVRYFESDIDYMFVDRHTICTDTPYLINGDRKLTIFQTVNHETAPGYTKLRLFKTGHSESNDRIQESLLLYKCGDSYLSSDLFTKSQMQISKKWNRKYTSKTLTRSGPAVPLYILETPDIVHDIAIICHCPALLRSWLRRPRRHNWPPRNVLYDISQMDAHVVPVGCKGSDTYDQEWRICFTKAEIHLVHSLNDTQIKVYIALKMVAKHICAHISSYIMKNIVLWMCEYYPSDLFTNNRLGCMFIQALVFLKRCVTQNFLPSYMIPETNIFNGRIEPEEKLKLTQMLSELIEEGPPAVMRVDKIRVAMVCVYQAPARADYYRIKRNLVEQLVMLKNSKRKLTLKLNKPDMSDKEDKQFREEDDVTLQIAVLNIILPEWRTLFHKGVNVTKVVEAKLKTFMS